MAGFLGSPSLATMIGPVAVWTISSVGLDDSSPDLMGFIRESVSFFRFYIFLTFKRKMDFCNDSCQQYLTLSHLGRNSPRQQGPVVAAEGGA